MCSIILEICRHATSECDRTASLAQQPKSADLSEGGTIPEACELPLVLRQCAVSVEGVLDTISSSHREVSAEHTIVMHTPDITSYAVSIDRYM